MEAAAPAQAWWADDHPVPTALTMTPSPGEVTADLVVVGLGASGLEAVVAAAEAGAEVVGVDAVGIAAGAAGRNGGFLLAGLADFHHDAVGRHGRALANAWWHRTAEEMDRLAEEEPTFARVGSLRIAAEEDEERDCLIHLAQMRRDGLDAAPYEGPEGRGLIVPGDGSVHPVARAVRLARRAVAAGARLIAPLRVEAVASGGVLAGASRLLAPRVVVAVDGGLERLVPSLRDRVRTARLQMLATAPLPPPHLPRPVYRRFGLDYFQQRPGGQVLLGGGRDVGGEAEWGAPATPSAAVQGHLDALRAELGLAGVAVSHRWAAHAAFTTDRLPVDVEVAPGVHVVGAFSGHGNVIGGMLARRAALRSLGQP